MMLAVRRRRSQIWRLDHPSWVVGEWIRLSLACDVRVGRRRSQIWRLDHPSWVVGEWIRLSLACDVSSEET